MVFLSSAALRMTGGTSMKRMSRSIGSTCILLARMRMRMKKCLLTGPVVRAKLCLLIWASPLPTAREVQAATMIPTMKLKRTWMGMMLPAAKHPKHGSKFLGKMMWRRNAFLRQGNNLGYTFMTGHSSKHEQIDLYNYIIYVCVYLSVYIYPNLSFIYLAPPCRTRQSRMLGRWCRMSWKSSNVWLDLWRNSLNLDQRKPQRPSSYIHLISNMHVLACQKQNRLLESNCKFCLTFFHPKHAFWGVLSRWRTTGRSSWSTTMSLPIWSLTLTHARVSLTKGPFPEI